MNAIVLFKDLFDLSVFMQDAFENRDMTPPLADASRL